MIQLFRLQLTRNLFIISALKLTLRSPGGIMSEYIDSILLLNGLLFMVVLQAIIAVIAHRKQTAYIPGVVASELDHHSFVFRSNRTFMNSLENVPVFILSAVIAMLAEASASALTIIVSVFLVSRIAHMVLFYAIATNKNPSPRSYFYAIGLVSQLYLIGFTFYSVY